VTPDPAAEIEDTAGTLLLQPWYEGGNTFVRLAPRQKAFLVTPEFIPGLSFHTIIVLRLGSLGKQSDHDVPRHGAKKIRSPYPLGGRRCR
jgi:hypothetical protein